VLSGARREIVLPRPPAERRHRIVPEARLRYQTPTPLEGMAFLPSRTLITHAPSAVPFVAESRL
jgi:hypothetical protein